ncbi:MAG: type IV secretory system conjugative DNA transfer family protein [Rhodobacteraceae bacterium]|nr:type IV secretory system conjugative DNA transfer family protein [Paracoccaceae bacterium]
MAINALPALTLTVMLAACAPAAQPIGDSTLPPRSADEILKRMAEDEGVPEGRRTAMRRAALQLGSQHGFAQRAAAIRLRLEARSPELSQIYDFNRVTTLAPQRTGYLLPPVIARSFDAFAGNEAGNAVSAADEYLEILQPASLSPTIPQWQDYLLFEPTRPASTAAYAKPRGNAEETEFKAWLREGWQAGVKLADEELSQRFNRLRRDYEGMLEYRRLRALGMVSAPELTGTEFGVTGQAGSMRIADRTAGIAQNSDFHRDSSNWLSIAPDG